MKWIDAEQKLNITIFDEQFDERIIKCMTIEDLLNTFTNEGCPEGWSDFECDWIPCSDRLPEKEGCYLITVDEDDRKDVSADFFYVRNDGTPSWHYENNVIAWMPLPEPYRGEQE